MSRPTRPQTRRPGGRTRPPGPIESAVLQTRGAAKVSTVRHVVEPSPEPVEESRGGGQVRQLVARGRGEGSRMLAGGRGVGADWARAARQAPRRWIGRLRGRHWIGFGAALLVLLGLAYLVLFSPVLDVRQVRLVGGDRFTHAQLDEIAASEMGRPLAIVDADALAARVEANPAVGDAQVVRAWPNTLEVRVDERTAVAFYPAAGKAKGFAVLAADGVQIDHLAEAPENLPVIDEATRDAGANAVRAATTVLGALALDQRGRVLEATAATPDSVQLKLEVPVQPDPGAVDQAAEAEQVEGMTRTVTVYWGSAEESALKAEVLTALLTTKADEYDVSAPRTPVTR